MPEPAPVDPEVATALLWSHLGDFFTYSPRVRSSAGWAYEITDDPLIAVVHLPGRIAGQEEPDIYALRLDASHYDTWPISVTFIEPHGRGGIRARQGTHGFPLLQGSPGAPPGQGPGFQFALHDDYTWPDQHTGQLVCFSYTLGYYTSNHTPTEDQTWRPGTDRLDATLSRIYTALNSQAYLGPSGPDCLDPTVQVSAA